MSAGEIIDTSLRLYQRLGLTFLRLTVVPTLLCLASIAFVWEYVVPGLFYSQDQGSFLVHVGNVLVAILLAVFVGGPLFLAGLSYTTALVVSMVSDFMVGNVVDPAAAQETARRTMPRLLLVNLRELVLSLSGILIAAAVVLAGEYAASVTSGDNPLAGIVALLGILGIVVGGVICLAVLAADAVVAPVSVLEDLGARLAGKRARGLMKRVPIHGPGTPVVWQLYFVLGFMLIVILGGLEASLALLNAGDLVKNVTTGLPFRPLILNAIDLAPSFLTLWTVIPVWATTVTMLYFDRRIRLEGFDIEILGRDLARSSRTSRFEL